MKKMIATAAGVAATVLLAAGSASAAPLGNIAIDTADVGGSAVQLIHNGNHASCQLGQRGWHFNDRRGNRIDCRPPRPRGDYIYWNWRTEGGRSGWYHRRDRRWN
jgi:hypothetical protein